jgi:hypothetical protein
MISDPPPSSPTPTEPSDLAAAYREEFLNLLAHLELEPGQAMALVEACTGRPFKACSPMQLVPVLHRLLELLHSQRNRVEQPQP